MNLRLLFVDDDAMLLNSTRRQLRLKLPDCELAFCRSAAEAMRHVEQATPDIILSDVRMPDVDGPELLRRVSLAHPETIRIAWTGQSETRQIQRVFGVAHQILSKPCPTEKLVHLISSLGEFRHPIRRSWLLAKLTAPGNGHFDASRLHRVLQRLDAPESSARSIAALIDESPMARARLLGLANSPFFSPAVPVVETSQAITLVGFDMVKAIFIASEFNSAQDHPPAVAGEIRRCLDDGIEMSIRVGRSASREGLGEVERSAAMIAALFHRFGAVQFAIHGGEDYVDARQTAGADSEALLQLEQALFGVDRFSVAAYFLSVWGLAPKACQAIASLANRTESDSPMARVLREVLSPSETPPAVRRGVDRPPVGAPEWG